jgi:tetratricopeptide (TPR) repeat protein
LSVRARAYRVAFALGAAAYAACFLAGLAYTLVTRGRLPAYDMNPLTEAREYLDRGDVQRAVQEYRTVARIDRGSFDTPRQVAELLRRVGDASGQIDAAAAARDRFPRTPAAHRNLGWAYFNNRRFDEALASFREALALDPTEPEAQRGIAEVWLEQDRFPEAIEAFRRALHRHPNDAAAHNGLAIALTLSGRTEEALRHFEDAARLDPGFAANLRKARAEAGGRR